MRGAEVAPVPSRDELYGLKPLQPEDRKARVSRKEKGTCAQIHFVLLVGKTRIAQVESIGDKHFTPQLRWLCSKSVVLRSLLSNRLLLRW